MKVFSNLAISIDGRIADTREPSRALGTPADRKQMDRLRAEADVIVTGSSTLKASPRTYRIRGAKRGTPQPANAILTASGELDATWKFWDDPEVVRFVFTTDRGLKKAMAAARERAFVVSVGTTEVDLNRVLERLRQSGLRRVLVEGGGETIASFLAANLVHELNVTLTPWALGGRGNPSLIGGDSALWKKLKLVQAKRVKHEMYLRYAVVGARRG